MFITSTFSVIRSRSLWLYFHASVILTYILKSFSWINVSVKWYVAVCLYKQLLKEGWASDMFITSTFRVIRSRLLWSYFHAPVILPYILKTISWINVILGILVLCDTMFGSITNVGHSDLCFMVQWFCHMSWMLIDVWTSLFGIMN